ncbi:membrane lipoprotein lipid attachment site-containing protein [Lysinibacillus sp. NPDC097231]|uniref:membrane lipoprotein lipid attachment site-containing protein n=1 Tax=Lysinibacillus sp. NPDC097231 TaxID=3364142 RepID=UPI003823DF22
MKKLLLVFFTVLILAACNSSTLSIREIENVPSKVQKVIDDQYTLQSINISENICYIVFQSKGTVTTSLETQGNTLIIKLDEANPQDNENQQHVYKLTLDPELEVINIKINGKSTHFDNVTVF